MSSMSKHLKAVSRNVATWPLGHQRAASTWTRDKLLLSAWDLSAQAEARKLAARKMEFGRTYTLQEVMALVADAEPNEEPR